MYKIINLRTGEELVAPIWDTKEKAETFIQAYIAEQWVKHMKIMEDCRYLNTAMFVSFEDTLKGLAYYQGKKYYPPEDKSYHFEVVWED